MKLYFERLFYYWRQSMFGHVRALCAEFSKENGDKLWQIWDALATSATGDTRAGLSALQSLGDADELALPISVAKLCMSRTEDIAEIESEIGDRQKSASDQGLIQAAQIFWLNGNLDRALQLVFPLAAQSPANQSAAVLVGWIKLSGGDIHSARRCFDMAVGECPAFVTYGKALYFAQGARWEEALRMFEHLEGIAEFPEASCEQARVYAAMNDWEKAVNTINKTKGKCVSDMDFHWMNVVQCLVKSGDLDNARTAVISLCQCLQEMESSNPAYLTHVVAVLNGLGWHDRDIVERLLHVYDPAVGMQGDNPEMLVQLGKLMLYSSRLMDAKECFEKALMVAGDYLPALVCLVETHMAMGQLREAQNQLDSLNGLVEQEDIPLYVEVVKWEFARVQDMADDESQTMRGTCLLAAMNRTLEQWNSVQTELMTRSGSAPASPVSPKQAQFRQQRQFAQQAPQQQPSPQKYEFAQQSFTQQQVQFQPQPGEFQQDTQPVQDQFGYQQRSAQGQYQAPESNARPWTQQPMSPGVQQPSDRHSHMLLVKSQRVLPQSTQPECAQKLRIDGLFDQVLERDCDSFMQALAEVFHKWNTLDVTVRVGVFELIAQALEFVPGSVTKLFDRCPVVFFNWILRELLPEMDVEQQQQFAQQTQLQEQQQQFAQETQFQEQQFAQLESFPQPQLFPEQSGEQQIQFQRQQAHLLEGDKKDSETRKTENELREKVLKSASEILVGHALKSQESQSAWHYESADERHETIDMIRQLVLEVGSGDASGRIVNIAVLKNVAIALARVGRFEYKIPHVLAELKHHVKAPAQDNESEVSASEFRPDKIELLIQEGIKAIQQGKGTMQGAFVCWRIMREWMDNGYFDSKDSVFDVKVNEFYEFVLAMINDTEICMDYTKAEVLECLKIAVNKCEKLFHDRGVVCKVAEVLDAFRTCAPKAAYECALDLTKRQYDVIDEVIQKVFVWSMRDTEIYSVVNDHTLCTHVAWFWKHVAKLESEMSWKSCRNLILGVLKAGLAQRFLELLYWIGESQGLQENPDPKERKESFQYQVLRCFVWFVIAEPHATTEYLQNSWNRHCRAGKLAHRSTALKLFWVIAHAPMESVLLAFLNSTPENSTLTNLETLYQAGNWSNNLALTAFDIYSALLENKPHILDPSRLFEIIKTHIHSRGTVLKECLRLFNRYLQIFYNDSQFSEIMTLLEQVFNSNSDLMDKDDQFSDAVFRCYIVSVKNVTSTAGRYELVALADKVMTRLSVKPQSQRSFGDLCELLSILLEKIGQDVPSQAQRFIVDLDNVLITNPENTLDCMRVLTSLLPIDITIAFRKQWLDKAKQLHKGGDVKVTLLFISRVFQVADAELMLQEKDDVMNLLLEDLQTTNKVHQHSYPQVLDTISCVVRAVYENGLVLSSLSDIFDFDLPRLSQIHSNDKQQQLLMNTSIVNCYLAILEVSQTDNEFITLKRRAAVLRFLVRIHVSGIYDEHTLSLIVRLLSVIMCALSGKGMAHMKNPTISRLLRDAQNAKNRATAITASQIITVISSC